MASRVPSLRPKVVVRKRPAPIPGMWNDAASLALKNQWRRGDTLEQFEQTLAARLEGAAVAAVSSGRFALLLVLEALGVRPPDRIIVPSLNASCVPNILQAAGYRLHFVDVDPQTLTVTRAILEDSDIPDDAPALIATHLEGCPASAHELLEWADRHGSWLIEDAAHALGARERGRAVGAIGHGAIFSLGRGKHLNTLGGGLSVIRNDQTTARRRLGELARALTPPPALALARELTMDSVVRIGTHPGVFGSIASPLLRLARRLNDYDPMSALFEDNKDALQGVPDPLRRRLSNLQAAFGLAGLSRFDRALERRRGHVERLRAALSDLPNITLQQPVPNSEPAWLELTAMVGDRAGFQRAMLKAGVDTQRTWMDACHLLGAFTQAGGGPCPNAARIAERAVYLPAYARLSTAEVDRIITAVRGSL